MELLESLGGLFLLFSPALIILIRKKSLKRADNTVTTPKTTKEYKVQKAQSLPIPKIEQMILTRVSRIYIVSEENVREQIAHYAYNLFFNTENDAWDSSKLERYINRFPCPPNWTKIDVFCDLRNFCLNIQDYQRRRASQLIYKYRWMVPGKGCYYKHHNIPKEKGGLNGFIFDDNHLPFDYLVNKPIIPGELLKCDCSVYPIFDWEKYSLDSPDLIKKNVVDFFQDVFMN